MADKGHFSIVFEKLDEAVKEQAREGRSDPEMAAVEQAEIEEIAELSRLALSIAEAPRRSYTTT